MPSAANFDFTDKTVLITGGGTGIGRSTADAFLAAGANVAVAGRRPEPLAAFVAPASERAVGIPADVSRTEDVHRIVAETVKRFGSLDIAVNNAAVWAGGPITDLADETWEHMWTVNVSAFFQLAKAALPHLESTGGSLIAVSSASGLGGDWGQPGYNATKGGLSNFVRSLALDWGARGVRINAVAPSLIDTENVAPLTQNPRLLAAFENRTAVGRIGTPAEVATAILFLASDAASYITGHVLPVDGGTTASSGQGHVSS